MRAKYSNIRGLEAELRLQVRIVALKQGISLGDAINQAMALWLISQDVQAGGSKPDGKAVDKGAG